MLASASAGCEDEVPCDAVGNICTLAGTGEFGFNHDGKPAVDSDLYLVSSVERGPDGRVWIMDFNNQRLRRIDDDGVMETVVGNGFHAFADVSVPILDSPLENPIDFDFYADGRCVFVSYHDPRVLFVGDDGQLHALAGAADGVLGTEGNEGDGGPATEALFIQLDGIAVTDNDTVYVSDSLANRVRRIQDGMIETVAGTGEQAYSGDGGPATEAALHWPSALALDAEGGLYIAETQNHVIRYLATDGTISTFAGTGAQGYGGDEGPATAAMLDQPYGLAVDEDGSVFISDRGNFVIRRVAPDGTIETVAGTGEQGLSRNGPALELPFGHLARLGMDGDGLLIAEQSNSQIRRLTLR